MKNATIIPTLTALVLSASAPAYAQERDEEYWANLPVITQEVHIGKYTLTITSKEDNMYTLNIDTPERRVRASVYQALNGVIAQVDAFPGRDTTSKIWYGSSRALIEDPEYGAMSLENGMVLEYTILDLATNSDAEQFVEFVYDKNHDGLLTEREMKEGGEKFSYFLFDAEIEAAPPDEKYHTVFVTSPGLTRFKEKFGAYQYDKKKYEPTEHERKLGAVIDYMIAHPDERGIFSLTLGEGIFHTDLYLSSAPVDAGSIFTIRLNDGDEYVDSGNNMYSSIEQRCYLDGQLDEVSSRDYDKFRMHDSTWHSGESFTRTITDDMQSEYEQTIDLAYKEVQKLK
ncbi:MAG: hypothetical protein WC254_00035 [Candidatus Woesearchaeota archaeon]|jgi:hypothetical protein